MRRQKNYRKLQREGYYDDPSSCIHECVRKIPGSLFADGLCNACGRYYSPMEFEEWQREAKNVLESPKALKDEYLDPWRS
jgi:hypothetical protein